MLSTVTWYAQRGRLNGLRCASGVPLVDEMVVVHIVASSRGLSWRKYYFQLELPICAPRREKKQYFRNLKNMLALICFSGELLDMLTTSTHGLC